VGTHNPTSGYTCLGHDGGGWHECAWVGGSATGTFGGSQPLPHESPNWGWDHWWAPTTPPVGTHSPTSGDTGLGHEGGGWHECAWVGGSATGTFGGSQPLPHESPNWGWDHWWAPTAPPVGTQAWGMRVEGGMSVPGWVEVSHAHLGGHSPSHMKALIGGGTTGGHPQPHHSVGTWSLPCGTPWRGTM
jgi:hypothetical protein